MSCISLTTPSLPSTFANFWMFQLALANTPFKGDKQFLFSYPETSCVSMYVYVFLRVFALAKLAKDNLLHLKIH